MRLNQKEVNAIIEAVDALYGANTCEIYLYGSRVEDTKKGGDIDICIAVKDQARIDDFNKLLSKLITEIHYKIGPQKIDISVIGELELTTDPFWKSSLQNKLDLRQALGKSAP